MKELNKYTGILFGVGIVALFGDALQVNTINYWVPLLLITGLIIALDHFPIKLPSGDEYTAGTIGSLLLLFEYGFVAGLFSIILSLFLLSIKKNKSIRNIKWVRYFVTLGMYSICSVLAVLVYTYTHTINLFVSVFLATSAFEITNHFLLSGIKRTLHGTPFLQNFISKMRELVIPVFVSAIVIPHFFFLDKSRELINDIYYTAFYLLIIIFFSNEFSKVITRQKRIEEELRATKEQLESFFTHTADGIFIFDLDGKISRINKAYETIFGWTEEEIIGEKILSCNDDLIQVGRDIFTKLHAGEQITGIEMIRHRKDGSPIYISLTLSPIRDENGNISAFAGIARDITQNKQADEALRESEAKYRLIAENMTDIIGVMDLNGAIKYISPSSQMVLGFSADTKEVELVFTRIHPDDLPNVSEKFNEMIQTKTTCQIEYRYQHDNQEWIVLEVHLSPVLGEEEEVEQIVFVAHDITERKQTEDLLRKSDKLSIVGQLAAGVAHEIRNPLTAIHGFAQLLQMGMNKEEYISIILSELRRIELIVNEFLVLAKPQVVTFEQKDVLVLLQSIIALLETQAIMNNIQIQTEFEPNIPLIKCEENQLKQVFVNILKNAIEAMPSGGLITIQVSTGDQGMLLIRFIDQGNGIPEERIPKLGEPFYTTKEKGTGLGLMVSYKIIQEHQGKIQFCSQLNTGTTVDILLPAVHPEVASDINHL